MAHQTKVRIHKRFYLYVLALLGWMLMAAVTGSRFFYFAAYAWLLLISASVVVHRINTKKIYMQFEIEKTMLSAGDRIPIRYRVINRSFIPAFHVRISPIISKAFGYEAFSSDAHMLDSYEVKMIDRWLACERRGFYTLGAVSFEATDALGMLTSQFAIEKAIELTVRPRIYPVRLAEIAPQAPLGSSQCSRSNFLDRSGIKSVRPYVPGDAPKDIHWKLSAKSGKLLTKEYTPSYEALVTLCLDAHRGSYESDGLKADHLVDLAASLCSALLKQKMRVRILLTDERHRGLTVRDEGDLQTALDFLTAFTPEGLLSFEDYMERRLREYGNNGHWITLSPVYSEKIYQLMKAETRRTLKWQGYLITDTGGELI